MKRLLAGIFFIGMAAVLPADNSDQIGGDVYPEDDIAIEDYSKVDIPKGKSEALAAFSEFMLAKTPEERLDKLMKAIEADPFATVPLGCFIRELDNVKDRKAYQARLIELSERHPDAVKLCMTAAYFLSLEKQQIRMLDLIGSCLKTVDFEKLTDKETANIASIISLAARTYTQTERYAEGDDFFRRYLDEKVLTNNLRFLSHALKFYNSAREKGKDEKGFWWFSESSKERYERINKELLGRLESVCEKEVNDVADVIPVLDVCRKNKADEFGADILFRMLKTSPAALMLLVFLAVYYDNSGMAEESFRVWRAVVKRDPMQVRFSLELGKVAEKTGRFEVAAAAYRNYLLSDPDDAATAGRLAMVCMRNGDFREAIEACAPMKDHPMALYISAMAYRQLKNYDKALEMMRQCEAAAVKMKMPNLLDDSFYRNMSFICERLGKIDNAESILKRLLAKKPDDPVTANCLGYILADNNRNLAEAHKLIMDALEKMPENTAIVDSMAWVLYRQGKYVEAARFIERALKLSGKYPDAIIVQHAGDIFFALKQRDRAVEYWRQALRTYTSDDDVNRQALQEKIKAADVKKP